MAGEGATVAWKGRWEEIVRPYLKEAARVTPPPRADLAQMTEASSKFFIEFPIDTARVKTLLKVCDTYLVTTTVTVAAVSTTLSTNRGTTFINGKTTTTCAFFRHSFIRQSKQVYVIILHVCCIHYSDICFLLRCIHRSFYGVCSFYIANIFVHHICP